MTTVFQASSYGRLIEIKSNLGLEKLHLRFMFSWTGFRQDFQQECQWFGQKSHFSRHNSIYNRTIFQSKKPSSCPLPPGYDFFQWRCWALWPILFTYITVQSHFTLTLLTRPSISLNFTFIFSLHMKESYDWSLDEKLKNNKKNHYSTFPHFKNKQTHWIKLKIF